jgi:hypothetical protein
MLRLNHHQMKGIQADSSGVMRLLMMAQKSTNMEFPILESFVDRSIDYGILAFARREHCQAVDTGGESR